MSLAELDEIGKSAYSIMIYEKMALIKRELELSNGDRLNYSFKIIKKKGSEERLLESTK